MRMIDANALMAEMHNTILEDGEDRRIFYEVIERQPTIEAVEVIRCKDCKWYEIYQLKKDGDEDHRYKPSYCSLFGRRFTPEWYCAEGERRGEEDE